MALHPQFLTAYIFRSFSLEALPNLYLLAFTFSALEADIVFGIFTTSGLKNIGQS
jgi:hypothetical protein